MVDVMQRAQAAAASERGRAVGAKKRAKHWRNTQLADSMRGPRVYKFKMDGGWAFIVAGDRREAKAHPSLPRGEKIWIPTPAELTRFSVALIRDRGDCIRLPRYRTNGEEA